MNTWEEERNKKRENDISLQEVVVVVVVKKRSRDDDYIDDYYAYEEDPGRSTLFPRLEAALVEEESHYRFISLSWDYLLAMPSLYVL